MGFLKKNNLTEETKGSRHLKNSGPDSGFGRDHLSQSQGKTSPMGCLAGRCVRGTQGNRVETGSTISHGPRKQSVVFRQDRGPVSSQRYLDDSTKAWGIARMVQYSNFTWNDNKHCAYLCDPAALTVTNQVKPSCNTW